MLAAVDLGSNSFRLHIGRHDGTVITVVHSAREPTRLAAGLSDSGALNAAAIQRGIAALERMGDVLKAHTLSTVRVVATNTLRIATNAAEFLSAAEKAIGFPIDVISGVEEAQLIYLGIARQLALPDECRLVIDIGGGSTELILGRGLQAERTESIGIGTVWQSQHFFPKGRLDEYSFDAAILHARNRFENAFSPSQRRMWEIVYGSSGTLRAISEIVATVNLGSAGVSLQNLIALKRKLIEIRHIDNIKFDKLSPERAGSLVGGLAILIGLMQALRIDALTPVEGGLRLGVMWDLHLRAQKTKLLSVSGA